MGQSIFQSMSNQRNNNLLAQANSIKKLIQGRDPNALVNILASRNPQFAQFVKECNGMNAEEICKKYGVDFNTIKDVLK